MDTFSTLSRVVEYHLLLVHDLDLLSEALHSLLAKQRDEVQRMLARLISRFSRFKLSRKRQTVSDFECSKLEARGPPARFAKFAKSW
jgi:hypothetical protein